MKTKILIVDDHTLFRSGVRSMIANNPNYNIVGEAGNGRTGVSLAEELKPDIVLMDISLPELNGIDATKRITEANDRVGVIAVSMHSDKRYVLAMLEAGARGYLLKDCEYAELERAIRDIQAGRVYLTPQVSGAVLEEWRKYARKESEATEGGDLSTREREVLQMIAEGVPTKQIALRLEVSIKTIENHRRNIMQKLDIDSVAGLTKYAIRQGITTAD